MSRHRSREIAFCFLYQNSFDSFSSTLISNRWNLFVETMSDIFSFSYSEEFSLQLINGVVLRQSDMNQNYFLPSKIFLKKMGNVEKTLVQIGVYENCYYKDKTNKAIVLDEIILISKKYGHQASSRFLNGVLDQLLN